MRAPASSAANTNAHGEPLRADSQLHQLPSLSTSGLKLRLPVLVGGLRRHIRISESSLSTIFHYASALVYPNFGILVCGIFDFFFRCPDLNAVPRQTSFFATNSSFQ